MLVKAEEDGLAHIRRPGMDETWCGQSVSVTGSTKDGEICECCLDAIIQAEQDWSDRQVKCSVG